MLASLALQDQRGRLMAVSLSSTSRAGDVVSRRNETTPVGYFVEQLLDEHQTTSHVRLNRKSHHLS